MANLNKRKIFITVGIISVWILVNIINFVVFQNNAEKLETRYIENQKEELKDKKHEFVMFFRLIYQNGRTISLLPGVRAIEGDNPQQGINYAIDKGGLSTLNQETIQQLYNNLAANADISEVYGILDDFDPDEGEVPYFMYDSLIIEGSMDDENDTDIHPSDEPVEVEEEEYYWFTEIIPEIKAEHPQFDFDEIDDIPFYYSPVMRTCDNTQYPSISEGNVTNTFGLIMVIPFYGYDHQFKGIIAVIFRNNILEAKLVGVPNIPVLESEKESIDYDYYGNDIVPSYFVLVNEKLGIRIEDRRNQSLPESIHASNENVTYLKSKVKLYENEDWVLYKFFNRDEYFVERKNIYILFVSIFILSSVIIGLLLFWYINFTNKKKIIDNISMELYKIGTSGGDLSFRISEKHKGDTKKMIDGFNSVLSKIENMVKNIFETSKHSEDIGMRLSNSSQSTIHSADMISQRIQSINETFSDFNSKISSAKKMIEMTNQSITDIAAKIDSQVKAVDTTSHSVNQMMNTTSHVIEETKDKKEALVSLSKTAQQSGKKLENSFKIIEDISNRIVDIADIIHIIDDISAQTNMLAMNASIEAAHAGEAGKGFAIVATEIRNLAENTSKNSTIISETLEKMIERIETAMEINEDAGTSFGNINNEISDVTQALQNVLLSLNELTDEAKKVIEANTNAKQITDEVRDNYQNMQDDSEQFDQTITNLSSISESILNNIDEISVSIIDIKSSIENISELSNKNVENIKILQNQENNFSDTQQTENDD